jgi:hypothetical protein
LKRKLRVSDDCPPAIREMIARLVAKADGATT